MKVGVFHPPFDQKYFGGSLAVTVPLLNSLAESGHDVILFSSNYVDQTKIREQLGINISPLVKVVIRQSILKPQGYFSIYETATNLLSLKMKCDLSIDTYSNCVFPWTDVSYIHFPYINNYAFSQRFPYLKRRRGLQRVFNVPYVFAEKNLESYEKKMILANSQFTSNAIKESLGAKAKVLYPPISNSFFHETSRLDNSLRENIVVTVGRIVSYKRMETIPEIANLVKERNVKFVLIGFGHDQNLIKQIRERIDELHLGEKISLLTDASRSEIKRILGKSKVYLHPPTLEHFGISIAEAMAMGCLPIVYNIGGAREFVPQKYRYETLFEAADKVNQALGEWTPHEAMKMIEIAQQFSESNFSRNFIKLFSSYLEEH